MRKKGSLSLSINAIVVLILAITMLGLGLGFITGMFEKVSVSVEEAIKNEPEPSRANVGNPITLSRYSMIVPPGDAQVLKVSVYNLANHEMTSAQPKFNCMNGLTAAASSEQVNARPIKQGDVAEFTYVFNFETNTQPGEYLCQMGVISTPASLMDSYNIDFTIRIRG